jgi:hypothetical protein
MLEDEGELAADAAPRILLLDVCQGGRDFDSYYLGTFALPELMQVSVEQ